MVEIRRAKPRDFEDLVDLAFRFTSESNLPLTHSEKNARTAIWNMIHDPRRVFLVAYEQDLLAGVAVLDFDNDFYVETVCYVTKFYVEVDFRGTMTAVKLVKRIIEEALVRECSAIFAASTANISQEIEEKYTRLYKKFGFDFLGSFLMRNLKDG